VSAQPLGPTRCGNVPTGSGRPAQIHGYDPPLAVPGESVQGIRTDIHSESTGFTTRQEPEVARPETEIAPSLKVILATLTRDYRLFLANLQLYLTVSYNGFDLQHNSLFWYAHKSDSFG